MIQEIRVADAKPRLNRACPFVRRAINQSSHSGLYQSAGAHCAGLNRGIHNHIRQPVVPDLTGHLAQGNHFRMSSRIYVGARSIAGYRQQFVTPDNTSADRYFATHLSISSCRDCLAHPMRIQICFHGSHDRSLSINQGNFEL